MSPEANNRKKKRDKEWTRFSSRKRGTRRGEEKEEKQAKQVSVGIGQSSFSTTARAKMQHQKRSYQKGKTCWIGSPGHAGKPALWTKTGKVHIDCRKRQKTAGDCMGN